MPGCSTVSHVSGGLSSTGMKDGLLQILVWTSLPLSGISADGTEVSVMVVVFSSFVSCGCELGNGDFVVSNTDSLLCVVLERSQAVCNGFQTNTYISSLSRDI